jgi:hypothetical protein
LHNLVRFVPQSPASSKKRGRKKEKKKKTKKAKIVGSFPWSRPCSCVILAHAGLPWSLCAIKSCFKGQVLNLCLHTVLAKKPQSYLSLATTILKYLSDIVELMVSASLNYPPSWIPHSVFSDAMFSSFIL